MLRSPADHSTGIFTKEDNYVRKRWRHVQYLVKQFWLRWRREYLQILQTISKWQQPQTNLKVEDIVLLLDDSAPRGKWRLGRIVDTYPDNLGTVRQVLVRTTGNRLLCRFLPNRSWFLSFFTQDVNDLLIHNCLWKLRNLTYRYCVTVWNLCFRFGVLVNGNLLIRKLWGPVLHLSSNLIYMQELF